MVILGFLLVLFGASNAIDLEGCYPQRPKEINPLLVFPSNRQITSPGYKEGKDYPENLDCEYVIRAVYGQRIKLTFKDLDVEEGDMCGRDSVEIVEVTPQGPVGLGVFCGNQTYPPIFTQGHLVSIIFRSDFLIGRRGFRIDYEVSGLLRQCNLREMPCRNRKCYSETNRCDGKDDCGDGTDEENCGIVPAASSCGDRKVLKEYGYDRIIGGKEAYPGSWPWQADLQVSFIHPNGHMCGGTLINAQWVLSAAHCFEQFRMPLMWRIHLGNHHKFKKDQSEQVRYGERIILYPGTTGEELLQLPGIDITNDIALLKLNAPVKFTDQVQPACLPAQGYELPVGKNCMASGWGMTRGTGSTDVLKEVDLTVQDAEVCNGIMGPVNNKTMICVKNSKGFQDVCHGDSGGPLVCVMNNKWHVMGATSFGSSGNFEGGLCALPESGTVYSKVSDKISWINEQINTYS